MVQRFCAWNDFHSVVYDLQSLDQVRKLCRNAGHVKIRLIEEQIFETLDLRSFVL